MSLDLCFTLQFSWVPKGLFNVSSASLTDPIMMVLMPCLCDIAEQIPFGAHVITHPFPNRAWHFRHNDLGITAGRQLFGETTGHGRAALIGIAVYAGIRKARVSQPCPFCHAEVPPVWEHLVWHCVDPVLAQGRPEPPLDEVLGGRQIAAAPVLLRCWHTRPDAGMCAGGCDFPFCLGYGVLLRCTGSCGLLLGDGGIWSW